MQTFLPPEDTKNDGEIGLEEKSDVDLSSRRCPICYEPMHTNDVELGIEEGCCNEEEILECVTVDKCNHTFCGECLFTHIKNQVETKEVPCSCPMNECTEHLSTELVRSTILNQSDNKKLLSRYEKIERLNNNPSLIECLHCDELFSMKRGDLELKCPSCSCTLRRTDGNSRSIVSFMTKEERQIRKSERVLTRMTKPCPNCGIRLQKANGCRHVFCTGCRKNMCWKCGSSREIYNSNCNCDKDIWSMCPDWCWLRCIGIGVLIAVYVVVALILTLIWASLALPTVLLTGCCCCGRFLDTKSSTGFVVLPATLMFFGTETFPDLHSWFSGWGEIPKMPVREQR